MKLINERILLECKAQKVSVKTLAAKVGMTEAGLYRSLKNDSLKVSTLIDIAKNLKIDPVYLLDPNFEDLIKDYRKLTNSLISVIIGLISDYGEFVNVLEKCSFKNPEIRKEINNYFFEYYSKESKKNEKKMGKNVNPRVKYLNELLYKKDETNFDRETIKKGTTKSIISNLKKSMETAEVLFQFITAKDPDFSTRNIEILYEFYINPN